MNKVHVVDTAVVTAFGDGLAPLWDGLMSGRTAIREVDRFCVDFYQSRMAASCPGLRPEEDRSIAFTLLDRLLSSMGEIPSDSGLLTATTKGGIDALERQRRSEIPTAFDALPEAFPRAVAKSLRLMGNGININVACASSTIAISRAAAQIASGLADAVLVVCLDVVSEFVFSGFSSLQALSVEPSTPFDRDRTGLTLGEGGAALLLMSERRMETEGRASLGTILGWGSANDANHITAPARDGCGLVDAVVQSLERARLDTGDIAAISAHGTGTVYNDLMELTAFRRLFGERNLPVNSVKGAIGHTLGAAGGIEVILGMKSLAERTLPPTAGLKNPEELGAECLSSGPQSIEGDLLLSTNSGFGGVNAAILLGRA